MVTKETPATPARYTAIVTAELLSPELCTALSMRPIPGRRYRVTVEEIGELGEERRKALLADFNRTTEDMRRNPVPEIVGMTDDEVMEWADGIVQEVRRAARSER